MTEFTGDFYKCDNCYWVWDYNDFACPNCGSNEFEVTNIHDELDAAKRKAEKISDMIEKHDA